MQRERITDHIFVFRSSLYAQVTAGVVLTGDGAVLIDTLLYPEESLRIRRFVEVGLGSKVSYVIITHFHADHTTGTCFFPDAQVISHRLCAETLATRGRESLLRMKASGPEFEAVELVLPNITFEDEIKLEFGETGFRLRESPGHSPDSIICLVEGEEILFAADTVMPIPYFVDGDSSALERSLARLLDREYENIVQGHGDIILRGEVSEKINSDLKYLHRLKEAVAQALDAGHEQIEDVISLEECGKSQVLLNGLVKQLHQLNIRALVNEFRAPELEQDDDVVEGDEGRGEWLQKKLI
ncbi:MAG: MBL fold metallo-hydrolase [Chloroflexi bacterium]|nr:MBL fold metallo-hydrolase [Chloroflexota bacterium]